MNKQILLVRGARQVGKTSFILDALKELKDKPQIHVNFNYPSSFKIDGIEYFGRDFFGRSPQGETFIQNLDLQLKNSQPPAIVFIDEADRYPLAIESIQTLAEFTDRFKIIMTGSNLENIVVKNAATGRKQGFDLYPFTFKEFLSAAGHDKEIEYLKNIDPSHHLSNTYMHDKLTLLVTTYIKLGGMPRILDAFFDPSSQAQGIDQLIIDLTQTIEENVKTVLGEKQQLYEYQDVLRRLALSSLDTLKYTHLQVQHAGRGEAKKLVHKTVGARVSHKIRLFNDEKDNSKFILFDSGIVNYLLLGSRLLHNEPDDRKKAILYETYVGNELISVLPGRDDLMYWKSSNKAELEFTFNHKLTVGIDVKATDRRSQSLDSFAVMNKQNVFLVKISNSEPKYIPDYEAKTAYHSNNKKTRLLTIPHYMTFCILDLLEKI
ncbi:MAG: AAA family ATPase [Deltaproteobacteria bacterium]|nr:AAA family ATPase [Deltaproteobacteria bacterium]